MTGSVAAADGTVIAYDRCGAGPAVLLVHGAFTDRTHPTLAGVAAAEVPAATVTAMRGEAWWPATEAIAHTLAYEAAVLGPGNVLPAGLLATITQPTLVLNGGKSPAWMVDAGRAVARTVPGAVHRILDDQAHNVAPEALAPELLEFFVAA